VRTALRISAILLGLAATLAAALAPTVWLRGRALVDATWQRPHFALALLLVPAALWFSTLAQDARRPRMRLGSVRALAAGPRGLRPYLRDLPGIVRTAALVLLIGAMCRPVNIQRDERVEDRGIDIVVVMDLSGSMRAILDGDPSDLPGKPEVDRGQRLTRLETAKIVVRDFIGRRKSDRIGVVVFAKKAFILSPPTLDYTLLSKLVSKLSLKVIDDSGTAIGDALATAVSRLRRSDAQSKVIVLLTDGDSNAGVVSPDYAAELAAEQKARVFAIQIGNGDEVEVDLDPDFGGSRTVRQRFPVNPELLQRIADKTDGKFFVATDGKALADSMHAVLDQLEKTRFEAPRSSYEDLFSLLLVPGVALVGLDALLRALLLRRFP
jgi:Ca-activated chloride channel family protein